MRCEKCNQDNGAHLVELVGRVVACLCPACLRDHASRVLATTEHAEWSKARRELEYHCQCAEAGIKPERDDWMLWQNLHESGLKALRLIAVRWLANEERPVEPEPAKGDPGAVLAEVVRTWTRDHRFVPCIADALDTYDRAVAEA